MASKSGVNVQGDSAGSNTFNALSNGAGSSSGDDILRFIRHSPSAVQPGHPGLVARHFYTTPGSSLVYCKA